jgi:tetratricopeptide (TPR) repeat protein
MYSTTQRILKLGPVALLAAVVSSPLAAQSREFPGSRFAFAFTEMDEARDLMQSGINLFDGGKYTEAMDRFRQVLQKYPRNQVASRCSYMLMLSLEKLNKIPDALAQVESFKKSYSRTEWADDVEEFRIRVTNQVPQSLMVSVAQTPTPSALPLAPLPPGQVRASTPAAPVVGVISGQVPGTTPTPAPPGRPAKPEDNPEVRLQLEILRVLFENNADRAIEIATDRLRSDPTDVVVLSSLYMVAQSRSDKAIPMLVTLAKGSPDSRTRRDAIQWIGRSRGEKDALADILVGLVPSMTGEEDSSAIAYALSQVNTPKAYDALATMARDKTKIERLRLDAVRSIGDARLTNRVTLLEDIYKSSMDNVRIRRTVVAYLNHGKEPQVVTVLSNIVSTDPDLSVRTSAVQNLSNIKTPEAFKALESFLMKKP